VLETTALWLGGVGHTTCLCVLSVAGVYQSRGRETIEYILRHQIGISVACAGCSRVGLGDM